MKILWLALAAAAAGCGPGPYVLLFAAGSGGGSGGGGSNASPAVSVVTPSVAQAGGSAEIQFEVSDREGDSARVAFDFSIDGSEFAPAAAAAGSAVANPDEVAATRGGRVYIFTWDTGADGIGNSEEVFVRVTASGGGRVTTGRFKVVNRPVRIVATALPDGEARPPENTGPDYAFDLAPLVRDGLPPFRFAVRFSPGLPGVAVAPDTGLLGGAPLRSGTYDVTISVDDAALGHAETTTALTILNPVRVAVGALPPVTPSADYEETIAARGGDGDYAFEIVGGALPAGLALDPATGLVSGTAPAAPELARFTVEARDGLGFAARREVKLRVAAAPPPIAQARLIAGGEEERNDAGHFVVDLDGNGLDDLLAASTALVAVSVGPAPDPLTEGRLFLDALLSTAGAAFEDAQPVAIPSIAASLGSFEETDVGPNLIAIGDWNGDGRPDLAISEVVLTESPPLRLHVLTRTAAPLDPIAFGGDCVVPIPSSEETRFGALAVGRFGGPFDGIAVSIVTPSGTASIFLVADPAACPAALVAGPADAPSADGAIVAGDLDADAQAEIHFAGTIYGADFTPKIALEGPGVEIVGRVAAGLPNALVRQVPADGGEGFVLEADRFDFGGATFTALAVAAIPEERLARLDAARTQPADALALVGVGAQGSIFLATVTESAIAPPSLDGGTAVQVGGLIPFAGPVKIDAGDDRYAFADARFLLLLARAGERLDGPEGRVAPNREARSVQLAAVRGGAVPDILVAGLRSSADTTVEEIPIIAIVSPDANGRLGPIEDVRAEEDEDFPSAAALLRLGGDRYLGILVVGGGEDAFSLTLELYGPLDGTIPAEPTGRVPLPSGFSISFATGDVDGDGRDEVMVNDLLTGFVSVAAIDDSFVATEIARVFTGSAQPFLQAIDLDRDGALDLFVDPPEGSSAGVVARGIGDGGFAPATLEPVGGFLTAFAPYDDEEDDAADVLALGKLDPFLSEQVNQLTLARNRDGRLGPPEFITDLPGSSRSIAGCDANLDGAPDAYALLDDGSVLVLEGDGRGGFVVANLYDFGIAPLAFKVFTPHRLTAGDLDGDGIDDVIVAGENGAVLTLFGDGRGGFRRAYEAP